MPPKDTIRDWAEEDVAMCAAIANSAMEYPWSKAVFSDSFSAHYHGFVVERGIHVLGFVLVKVIADTIELMNICVDMAFQHQGLGRQLLQQAIDFSREQKAVKLLLEVRESNLLARALYESAGFQADAVREAYYPVDEGDREAAILYSLALSR